VSSEHSPIRQRPTAPPGIGHNGPRSEIEDSTFWHELIDERVAAEFLKVTPRSMQKFRQTGDGPQFIRISSRCIRYTRVLLKAHADARLRNSTSDPGDAA